MGIEPPAVASSFKQNSATRIPSRWARANLSWDEIRLPHAGIVSVKTRGLNQDGDIVVTWKRSVMVYKRDAPMHKGHFPEAAGPIDATK